MLSFDRVHQQVKLAGKQGAMLSNASRVIPKNHYALLVENPNHRKHIVDLLCGTRPPKQGWIDRSGRTSWAIGRPSFTRGNFKAHDIVGLICRLYDLDRLRTERFLGDLLTMPELLERKLTDWPPALRPELGLALALCPSFKIYVTDASKFAPPGKFGAAWLRLFEDRVAAHGLIMSSLNVANIMYFCKAALVVRDGNIEIHEHLESALDRFPPRPANLAADSSKDEPDDEEPI